MNIQLAPAPPTAIARSSGMAPTPNSTPSHTPSNSLSPCPRTARLDQLLQELEATLGSRPAAARRVLGRTVDEVERVCSKSDRIQTSGCIESWQLSLARHRLQKYIHYFQRGSQRGRTELHGTLSAMIYRHITPANQALTFQGRYTLIEDFMQAFYIEALRAFRRENNLQGDYQPRTRFELAEYLAFVEQYAKRRISLPGCRNQQLIVLRAKSFSRRMPPELAVDIEMAVQAPKTEEGETQARSSAMQQVREQMVADAVDPADAVLRDRIITELIAYLQGQSQQDCIDYFVLRLQDLSAPEIDAMLGLTARQRDYLQQRFKYHVERFARIHNWELVHLWLGADLDTHLGLSQDGWGAFVASLTPQQQEILTLKQKRTADGAIAKHLGCTPKQLQKRWFQILTLASQARNGDAQTA
ncbi:MAG: hypothetical protein Fur0042_00950 [Cyanophyceae cyanobacterium]